MKEGGRGGRVFEFGDFFVFGASDADSSLPFFLAELEQLEAMVPVCTVWSTSVELVSLVTFSVGGKEIVESSNLLSLRRVRRPSMRVAGKRF